ncbi:MAG: DUF1311 domain-containing protein [Proteobacteria bacterium]|nr:DUF1311 domain-containing protein [Pseudomonadota bacterium]
MKAVAILLAGLLVGPSAAVAADEIATAREACTDKESQTEMNLCTRDLHQKVDAELKRTYDAVLARATSKVDKANLRGAQRAWTTYLTKQCAFTAAGVEGGSAHATIFNLCALDLTELRLQELAYYLTCEEGDLSCPYPANR